MPFPSPRLHDDLSQFTENTLLHQYLGPWDHKKTIVDKYGQDWIVGNAVYYYDIWSNIHYGYVGKSLGFHEEELLAGAGIAQFQNEYQAGGFRPEYQAEVLNNDPLSTYFDTPQDRAAIKFGIDLWDTYGYGLTEQVFLNELSLRPELERQ